MTQQEYDQKKRECWEEFCRANPSHNKSIFARKVFDYAFDRAYALDKEKAQLHILFGSKCLPDEACNIASSDVASSKPKPAEPKFTKEDMVHCKSFGYEGDYKVLEYTGGPRNCYDCIDKYGAYYRFYESDLEPYTEPKENVNHRQNIANCDKQFDNILKDSFSKERRLNVAVQMVKAIMQCPETIERIASAETDSLLDDIVEDALHLTDRLIAECEKGGSK